MKMMMMIMMIIIIIIMATDSREVPGRKGL